MLNSFWGAFVICLPVSKLNLLEIKKTWQKSCFQILLLTAV